MATVAMVMLVLTVMFTVVVLFSWTLIVRRRMRERSIIARWMRERWMVSRWRRVRERSIIARRWRMRERCIVTWWRRMRRSTMRRHWRWSVHARMVLTVSSLQALHKICQLLHLVALAHTLGKTEVEFRRLNVERRNIVKLMLLIVLTVTIERCQYSSHSKIYSLFYFL